MAKQYCSLYIKNKQKNICTVSLLGEMFCVRINERNQDLSEQAIQDIKICPLKVGIQPDESTTADNCIQLSVFV